MMSSLALQIQALKPYVYFYCQNNELGIKTLREKMRPLLERGELVKLDNKGREGEPPPPPLSVVGLSRTSGGFNLRMPLNPSDGACPWQAKGQKSRSSPKRDQGFIVIWRWCAGQGTWGIPEGIMEKISKKDSSMETNPYTGSFLFYHELKVVCW
jgi:hypothetical protein